MALLELLQRGATVILNGSVALAAGALLASIWLAQGGSGWAGRRLPALRRCALAGIVLATLASAALLWLEAAAMAEVPLADALPAVLTMLSSTHYGLAVEIGAGALAAALLLRLAAPAHKLVRPAGAASLLALAAFLYTRSMVSHAAADGDFSVAMLADWVHLVLVSLWMGEVFVAALLVLPGSRPQNDVERAARSAYVQALSTSATVALAGIVVTGAFAGWRQLGSPANVFGNPYANLLLAKVALVVLAVLLGGINRFVVMPRLLRHQPSAATHFRQVLKAEAVLLLGVLTLAAMLASTSPPDASVATSSYTPPTRLPTASFALAAHNRS